MIEELQRVKNELNVVKRQYRKITGWKLEGVVPQTFIELERIFNLEEGVSFYTSLSEMFYNNMCGIKKVNEDEYEVEYFLGVKMKIWPWKRLFAFVKGEASEYKYYYSDLFYHFDAMIEEGRGNHGKPGLSHYDGEILSFSEVYSRYNELVSKLKVDLIKNYNMPRMIDEKEVIALGKMVEGFPLPRTEVLKQLEFQFILNDHAKKEIYEESDCIWIKFLPNLSVKVEIDDDGDAVYRVYYNKEQLQVMPFPSKFVHIVEETKLWKKWKLLGLVKD